MNRSAASSSSAVVTPGWHLERSMWRQRAWIAPAAAIWSICSGVLRMITENESRALQLLFLSQRREKGADPAAHLVGRHLPVNAVQNPPLLVMRDEGLRLVV